MLLTELFSLYHRINFSKALYICVHKLYNERKRAFQAAEEVLIHLLTHRLRLYIAIRKKSISE